MTSDSAGDASLGDERLRHSSLAVVAQDWIANQILRGKIKPGERLAEVALAEQMGISRSPVREALRTLGSQGLVIIEPRRGAFVAEIDVAHAEDLYACRMLLEPACIRLGVDALSDTALRALEAIFAEMRASAASGTPDEYVRALTEYNRQLLDACPNRIIFAYAEATWRSSLRYWGLLVRHSNAYATQSLKRNSKVHAAVAKRNGDKAAEAMSALLQWSRQELLEVLASVPAE